MTQVRKIHKTPAALLHFGILLLLLIVFMLTSCGGSEQRNSDTASNEGTVTQPPLDEPGMVTAMITLFAGTDGGGGRRDGIGMQARFNQPHGAAQDQAGNIFVADSGNNVIRKIAPDGMVSTFAGGPGDPPWADGPGAEARFNNPTGIAVDKDGYVYVADKRNNAIRKISPDGLVTTLAGQIGAGNEDGLGSSASFYAPSGVALDANGNIYVADTDNNAIRKITPDGNVTTVAGSKIPGPGQSVDGPLNLARFNHPTGVAVDSTGNIYVADQQNATIRKISSTGIVSTLAGTAGAPGWQDGAGSAARFRYPFNVAVDNAGNVYVIDLSAIESLSVYPNTSNDTAMRKISAAGVVTTMIIKGTSIDQSGLEAPLQAPTGIAVDTSGSLLVTDSYTVRRITPDKVVRSIAGKAFGVGNSGGVGGNAGVRGVEAMAVDAHDNLYVVDSDSVLKLMPDGSLSTIVSQLRQSLLATANYIRAVYADGIAIDATGNLYVSDGVAGEYFEGGDHGFIGNSVVYRVGLDGSVMTVAGQQGELGSEDGPGSSARFYGPTGLAIDAAGNIFVADRKNSTIRKITPDGNVTTFAGAPREYGSADGLREQARFFLPTGLAIDSAGNLYVSDTGNYTIRKITPDGMVSTIAGVPGQDGSVDGMGVSARFRSPAGIAVDHKGNIYVADRESDTIRRISSSGMVTTIVGTPRMGPVNLVNRQTGSPPENLDRPSSVAIDSTGSLYVATYSAILKVEFRSAQ